jgi:hypothetical protein
MKLLYAEWVDDSNLENICVAGLKLTINFGKLHPGQFTVPRFSSLSGALMCDSK